MPNFTHHADSEIEVPGAKSEKLYFRFKGSDKIIARDRILMTGLSRLIENIVNDCGTDVIVIDRYTCKEMNRFIVNMMKAIANDHDSLASTLYIRRTKLMHSEIYQFLDCDIINPEIPHDDPMDYVATHGSLPQLQLCYALTGEQDISGWLFEPIIGSQNDECIQWALSLPNGALSDTELIPMVWNNGNSTFIQKYYEEHQGATVSLSVAAAGGNLTLVKLMLSRKETPDTEYQDAIYRSAEKAHLEVLKFLIENKPIKYENLLIHVAESGNPECFAYALSLETDQSLQCEFTTKGPYLSPAKIRAIFHALRQAHVSKEMQKEDFARCIDMLYLRFTRDMIVKTFLPSYLYNAQREQVNVPEEFLLTVSHIMKLTREGWKWTNIIFEVMALGGYYDEIAEACALGSKCCAKTLLKCMKIDIRGFLPMFNAMPPKMQNKFISMILSYSAAYPCSSSVLDFLMEKNREVIYHLE